MTTLEAPPRSYTSRGGNALAAAPQRRPSSLPAEVQPRHLRVVAPTERVRRRLTPAFGVVVTGLLFVTLFLIAIAHTVLVQGQVRLDGLGAELSVEQARYQELRMQLAEMESPSRIVAAASDLGMVSPDDLVYLQPETHDPVPGEGSGDAGASDEVSDGAGAGSTWSVMKPLLESSTP